MSGARVTIVDAEQLGGAMTEKLAELFDEEGRRRATPSPANDGGGPRSATRPGLAKTTLQSVRQAVV